MKTHIILILCIQSLTSASAQNAGGLDITFGSGGYVSTDFQSGSNESRYLLLQPDGKIIVLGNTIKGQAYTQVNVIRYLSNGTLDAGFGTGGIFSEETFGINSGTVYHREVWSGALQSDGKILLAGNVWTTTLLFYQFIIRLDSNGVPDPAFGNAGVVLLSAFDPPPSSYEPRPISIAALDDGKILAFSGEFKAGNFTLIRLGANGTPDAAFGNGGFIHTKSSLTSNFFLNARALTIQPDKKILAQGVSHVPPGLSQMHIFRFFPDGTRDNTFSGDGEAVTEGNGDNQYSELHNRIGLMPNGNIVVGMYSSVTRFQPNGLLDSTFGNNGRMVTGLKSNGLIVQANGKIVCAGSLSNKAILYRLNTNGEVDSLFGNAGISDFLPALSSTFTSVLQQPDGKIIACGKLGSDFVVARYLSESSTRTDNPRKLLSEVTISPNPTTDAVRVYFNLLEDEYLSITLFNVTGQMVRVVAPRQFFAPGDHTVQTDLSDLPAGAYILSVTNQRRNQNLVIELIR